jgi:CRP-like cAMP-binding protein
MSGARPLEGFETHRHTSTAQGPAAASRGQGKRRSGGRERFVRMLNPLVDLRLRELTPAEVRVWLILYRDERGGVSRTSHADLARRAGVSTRAVVRALNKLRDRKLVERVRRGRMNVGISVHRLLPPMTR